MINFSLLEEAFPNDDKSLRTKKKSTKDKQNNEEPTVVKGECKTIQAPIYTIPMTCDSNKLYQDAINVSMGDSSIINDNYKKNGIKSHDFDEMDAYLNISDINNNNKKEEFKTIPDIMEYLKTLRENFTKDNKQLNIEQFTNNNSLKVDVNLYNLFLFMFLGIIIILLIDQITKLVIHS